MALLPEIATISSPPKDANPILLDTQSKKRDDQVSRLSSYPEWHLKEVLLDGATDMTTLARSALSEREREIVAQDGVSLQAAFLENRCTAVEVAKAFFHAAVIAHQLTNCLTEIFFDEGLARAEELDKHYKKTGRLVGPLHGLPISIKDALSVRGQDASSGFAGFAGKTYAESDAVIVHVLRKAGAVIFAKTAVPQTLMVGPQCIDLQNTDNVPESRNKQQQLRENIEPI
jgi:amidase